jgi:hypothetical protein
VPPSGELYIRYSATDHGERDIPSNQQWWLSPAIELIGSGLGAGFVLADVDQLVRVYVGNQGSNAHTDVTVQVYAADWGTMNPYLLSLGGSAGRSGGPFTVVGDAKWETSSEGMVDIGWHPSVSDLGGAKQKHVCLLANVYRPGDGAAQSDPPVFNIPTNQHHAQHNMTLVATAADAGAMGMSFHAANLTGKAGAFLLEVTETGGPRLDALDRRQLASAEWVAKAQAKLGEPLQLRKKAGGLTLEVKGQKTKGPRVELKLEAGQQVPVLLRAKPSVPKKPGLHRFTIVQREAKSGRIVGGARLLVAILPKRLIPKPLLADTKRLIG